MQKINTVITWASVFLLSIDERSSRVNRVGNKPIYVWQYPLPPGLHVNRIIPSHSTRTSFSLHPSLVLAYRLLEAQYHNPQSNIIINRLNFGLPSVGSWDLREIDGFLGNVVVCSGPWGGWRKGIGQGRIPQYSKQEEGKMREIVMESVIVVI